MMLNPIKPNVQLLYSKKMSEILWGFFEVFKRYKNLKWFKGDFNDETEEIQLI